MAEYWKSIPKLWCASCKCFYAGNNIGITNHERSLKHQNSLKNALKASAQNLETQTKKQNEINHAIIQMEQAALNSMKGGDGCSNKNVIQQASGRYGIDGIGPFIPTVSIDVSSNKKDDEKNNYNDDSKKKLKKLIKESKKSTLWSNDEVSYDSGSIKSWVEYNSQQGKYYFNMYTQETQWEVPDSFYTQDEYEEMILKSYTMDQDKIQNPVMAAEPVSYVKPKVVKKDKELLYDPKSIGRIVKEKGEKRKRNEEVKKEQEPNKKKTSEFKYDYDIPKTVYATPMTLGPWVTVEKVEEPIKEEPKIDYSKELPPEALVNEKECPITAPIINEPIEIKEKVLDTGNKKTTKTISFQKRSGKAKSIRTREE
uniref:WW domain-containing protein n=1 Tax=Parastrongyloides trichosuri TaxID=131310 RepID=A0A0N5A6C7_PARTI